jgi:ribosomal protein S18 acetylase RimI-like enzyme
MIRLRKMSDSEFREYLDRSIPEFAEEKVRVGNWTPAEAAQRSEETFQRLLPEGISTPDHHLYKIEQDGVTVGEVWLAMEGTPERKAGYIYDVFIAEPFRRRGIATHAMRLLEKEAVHFGFKTLGLHVFGDNQAAIKLYKKLGYEVTNLMMSKMLDG